jgi:hypothetical protein
MADTESIHNSSKKDMGEELQILLEKGGEAIKDSSCTISA